LLNEDEEVILSLSLTSKVWQALQYLWN